MSEEHLLLVDSHCHLPLIEAGEGGVKAIVERAQAAGVRHMLCVSVDLESFPGVAAAAAGHPCVSATVGVHPNTEGAVIEPTVETLVEHARHPDIVAIGETGLDYYRSSGDLDWQRRRFRTHIAAAREAGKPLVIHCREAAADLLTILRAERGDEIGGVMHCFVEDWATAQAAMDLGFYISLSGIVTFKSARDLQEVARRVPLERLLIETDAPWLAPVPRRGKQNEPAYVRHTAEFLAALREEDLGTLAAATSANFFRLFADAVDSGPGPAIGSN
ncbi:MAG: TatD family hydrolase [Gammaproteobacteria bacterium]